MLRSIIFLEQSQVSDYARMRLAALKICAIPVRVFTEPISGFSASTFGETPNSDLRLAEAVSQWCLPRHRYLIEK
jgi:hypothetical protein